VEHRVRLGGPDARRRRPKIEAAAVDEAKKLGYTMRDCAKEK
jgi:hypothetical protein